MNKLNDHDWELVNAYHDGELSTVDRATLERRRADEPALAAALADIRQVSAALRQMRPALAPAPARAPQFRLRGMFLVPLALAASVAAALFVASALFSTRPGAPETPAQWHARFLRQEYSAPVVERLQTVRLFGLEGVPDLSAASLALVDQRLGADGALALHYSGQSGCRLTLTAGFLPGTLAVGDADELSHFWSVGPVNYQVNFMVLATGMDPARFAAISDYVQQLTEQAAAPELIMAMRIATDKAVPCGA